MDANVINKHEYNLENIFFETIIKQKIIIQSKYLNSKINDYIYNYIKNSYEGKCISEGYIQNDSIEIINKSIGTISGSRFTGDITYDILYKAKICNPLVNDTIDCEVKFINKLGLLCNNGPITIIVGRQFHNNQLLLDKINVGDIIKVLIIAKKYSLNDKIIEVTAKLSNDIHNNNIQKIIEDDMNSLDNDLEDLLEQNSLLSNEEEDNQEEYDSLEEFDYDENDDIVENDDNDKLLVKQNNNIDLEEIDDEINDESEDDYLEEEF